jgi:hypothetical protein
MTHSQLSWYATHLQRALAETNDGTEAVAAANLALAMHPERPPDQHPLIESLDRAIARSAAASRQSAPLSIRNSLTERPPS